MGGGEWARSLSCKVFIKVFIYLFFREEDGNEHGKVTGHRHRCVPTRKFQRLVKISFLVKVKTTVRLGIKFRFGVMGTNDTIWGFSP